METVRGLWKTRRKMMAAMLVLLVAMSALYVVFFLQRGIFVRGYFLPRTTVGTTVTEYARKTGDGTLGVRVERSGAESRVVYTIRGNAPLVYSVVAQTGDGSRRALTITDEQTGVSGERLYAAGDVFLCDALGEPLLDAQDFLIDGERIGGLSDFQPSELLTVEIATGFAETMRGNVPALLLALILFASTFVSVKYPLFTFYLRHWWDCENAIPSEWYLTMQKILRVVMLIGGGIFLIVSLTVR